MGEATSLVGLRQEIPDTAGVDLAQLVDVLRLDGRREFLVRNLRQVIVELRSGEVVEDFFPVRLLAAVVTQVRRHLPAQEAHTRGLADSVRTEQANDLPLLRDRGAGETKRGLSLLMYGVVF